MRFVVAVDEHAQRLPMSLCAGVDETTLEVRPLDRETRICVLDLPAVEPGQRSWIGLRLDDEVPAAHTRWARVLILSVDSERL